MNGCCSRFSLILVLSFGLAGCGKSAPDSKNQTAGVAKVVAADLGLATVTLTELSAKKGLYCGRFLRDDSVQPRAFVLETSSNKITIEPAIPTALEMSAVDAGCAGAVARAGAFLPPGDGCSGLNTNADNLNAASDFLEHSRQVCAGAMPVSLTE